MKKLKFRFFVIALLLIMVQVKLSYCQSDTLTITNKSGSITKIAVQDIKRITTVITTNVKENPADKGSSFTIKAIYPNPFRNEVNIGINISKPAILNITVYDIVGRIVKTISFKADIKGTHYISWDGKNSAGDNVRSGIYFLNITSANNSNTVKLFKVE